ncbi:MAG: hypothetical protein GX594_15230 [Pirellulaceae bacterium]|nr:hypothetical protein [Pirellulaceae bacterium]
MERSVLRVSIGLPPVDGVDFEDVKRRLWCPPSVWPKIALGVFFGALILTAAAFLTLRGLKRKTL